jgi:hypothetical protein
LEKIIKKALTIWRLLCYNNIVFGGFMFNIGTEKDKLIKKLGLQYSHNIFGMEEYERITEYINKVETKNEIILVEKIVNENSNINPPVVNKNRYNNTFLLFSKRQDKEKYLNISGSNIIVIDKLPLPKYKIYVNTFWGTTEIIVPKKIRIKNKLTTFFSIVKMDEVTINKTEEELPELEIVGLAKFSKIIIKRE